MPAPLDSFGARSSLSVGDRRYDIFRLDALTKAGAGDVSRLPFSLKILLENLLRYEDGRTVTKADVAALAAWDPAKPGDREVWFRPARVLMQDFTGVPCVVDLAAMRDAIKALGGDPRRINPMQTSELVIDHSVQVDEFGSTGAFAFNARLEMERNEERYALLRWGQQAFDNFAVVPPDTGIVHQVNLEYLAKVVFEKMEDGALLAYPDTLVGTDSHTTMINGLGVLGWGVGGIEAEAAMLGQPMPMLTPEVVGFKFSGQLREGATATDAVLTVTQMLRAKGVVGKFVEFYGRGLSNLSLADRATIANMAPEYGATMGFFPVDAETLAYLRFTGRDEAVAQLVETYTKAQGLFRTDDTPDPIFSDTLSLDLGEVEPSIAGPKRPQDRVRLADAKASWRQALVGMLEQGITNGPEQEKIQRWLGEGGSADKPAPEVATPERAASPFDSVTIVDGDQTFAITHGAVVIAAITSCTNTSNPAVMLASGLLAKKAVERGLRTKPWVKTSLAPGSQVVTAYLDEAGLTPYLEQLGFYLVGYGCTTCIGNSGPLPERISEAVRAANLVAAAVLSGNRNFEGRVNAEVRANYLASPPLVVAYALAGTMDIDLHNEPLGTGADGARVYLRDIWPSQAEIHDAIRTSVTSEMFREKYAHVFEGTDEWRAIDVPEGNLFAWDDQSTYVRRPPYFDGMTMQPAPVTDVAGARVLAVLGDSITTDHISPAGSIAKTSPAAKYLVQHEVAPEDFNTYGTRRGNHEVMIRGTFANIRLRNQMVAGEGGLTKHLPDGEQMSIYDASMRYQEEGTPLIILAGAEYGSGSSRDWAAKGTLLLGVRAVIAKSYERIHRSNLVAMSVLPLQFEPGQDRETLALTGEETYDIDGIAPAGGNAEGLAPGKRLTVRATAADGSKNTFTVVCRIDTPVEVDYYAHGGILPYVLRQLVGAT